MVPPCSPDLGEAESLSDDTSVDSRQTGSLPVSIYGQAMGHRSPHWIKVLRHAVDRRDEVKGEEAWRVIDSLQPDARAEVKRGIRSVRIHVVDARLYLARLRSIWGDAVGEARTTGRRDFGWRSVRRVEPRARSSCTRTMPSRPRVWSRAGRSRTIRLGVEEVDDPPW